MLRLRGTASLQASYNHSIKLFPVVRASRHASTADWVRIIAQRRKAAAELKQSLFLDDLLEPLSVEQQTYPFASLQDALGSLFLSGALDQQALQQKLSVLLYFLLDGGQCWALPDCHVCCHCIERLADLSYHCDKTAAHAFNSFSRSLVVRSLAFVWLLVSGINQAGCLKDGLGQPTTAPTCLECGITTTALHYFLVSWLL